MTEMRNTRRERHYLYVEVDEGGMKKEVRNRGRGEGQRKLQAHYVQGEWQVSYSATFVIVCVMQRQICGCKQNCIEVFVCVQISEFHGENVCMCGKKLGLETEVV